MFLNSLYGQHDIVKINYNCFARINSSKTFSLKWLKSDEPVKDLKMYDELFVQDDQNYPRMRQKISPKWKIVFECMLRLHVKFYVNWNFEFVIKNISVKLINIIKFTDIYTNQITFKNCVTRHKRNNGWFKLTFKIFCTYQCN